MNHIIHRPDAISKIDGRQLDFILLDSSGSMLSDDKWGNTCRAIDGYVAELQQASIKSHIVVHSFDDTNIQLEQRRCNIEDYIPNSKSQFRLTRGMTPLYDAIVMMGRNVKDCNPVDGASILICTDGEDSGRGYNKFADLTSARAVLDWLRAQGYQVTFLGCDFNNQKQAEALGANSSNTIAFRKEVLKDAGKLLAGKRIRNVRTGEDISFTDEEKIKFGGYLNGPSS